MIFPSINICKNIGGSASLVVVYIPQTYPESLKWATFFTCLLTYLALNYERIKVYIPYLISQPAIANQYAFCRLLLLEMYLLWEIYVSLFHVIGTCLYATLGLKYCVAFQLFECVSMQYYVPSTHNLRIATGTHLHVYGKEPVP
jgi:hypothetical protein